MRRILFIILVLALMLGAFFTPSRRAAAQSGNDLLAAVNALRTDNGLSPYQYDASLAAIAQQHSEYQASIGTATHTRADGSTPATLGFIENIDAGLNLTPQGAVDSWLGDQPHIDTMLGISAGFAGAGAAVKDGVVYYTLIVKRSPGGVFITPKVSPPGGSSASGTAVPQQVIGVETVTPAPDGSIVHVVQPGQSAWSIAIAYNIKMADLITMNNLADPPVLRDKQKLFIRLAFTPTLSPTVTKTPRPPTRTPTLTRTPRPPTLTPTITPTVTPTAFSLANALPSLGDANRRLFGMGLIAVCALGLVLVVFGSLRKKG